MPAGTTYSTIGLEGHEDTSPRTMRKVFHVSAVLFAVVVMFFAGRVYEAEITPFTHEEVMNVAAKCSEGSFIGDCTPCRDCATYEFVDDGGCDYFQDTFCTFCEPIANCPRKNIVCDNRYNQECSQCEPGFWDVDCKPCTVCKPEDGVWEYSACEQTADAVCRKCSDLPEDSFVTSPCAKTEDAKFENCYHCPAGKTTDTKCVSGKAFKKGSLGSRGTNTQCRDCAECGATQWASGLCTEYSDTQCSDCDVCDEGEPGITEEGTFFTNKECRTGSWQKYGANTECAACTIQEELGGVFEAGACGGLSDAKFVECTDCVIGQYEAAPCSRSADRVCPTCTSINHCEPEMTICEEKDTSKCRDSNSNDETAIALGFCNKNQMHGSMPVSWFGETCQYMKTTSRCGTDSYRERQARRGKFKSSDINEFIAWCMDMCEVFSDCLGFEVDDNGTGIGESGNFVDGAVNGESMCYLKNTPTVEITEDYSGDCYSNIQRQVGDVQTDEDALLALLNP